MRDRTVTTVPFDYNIELPRLTPENYPRLLQRWHDLQEPPASHRTFVDEYEAFIIESILAAAELKPLTSVGDAWDRLVFRHGAHSLRFTQSQLATHKDYFRDAAQKVIDRLAGVAAG